MIVKGLFKLDQKGMGTVEVVIIVAVLVGVALIFRDAIVDFVNGILGSVFDDSDIMGKLGGGF